MFSDFFFVAWFSSSQILNEIYKALQSLNISIDSALEQRQVENK